MKTVLTWLIAIVFSPILILFLLGCALYTPIDYFRYKRTRYFQDTQAPYCWFASVSYCVRLYEIVKSADLPIEFHHRAGIFGYFVYRDVLILNEYTPCYDADRDMWTVEVEDAYIDIRTAVDNDLRECNEFLNSEICHRAVVLIDNDELSQGDLPSYDKVEFLLASPTDTADVLRKYIEEFEIGTV